MIDYRYISGMAKNRVVLCGVVGENYELVLSCSSVGSSGTIDDVSCYKNYLQKKKKNDEQSIQHIIDYFRFCLLLMAIRMALL